MGVPHFYKYVSTKHRNAICVALPEQCDALMIDLNCAVHRCAEGIRGENVADKVIDNVVAWLRAILDVCKPMRELFIALDGVPPRAKMVQQRSRRFISRTVGHLDEWDSCCVTPGTEFMSKLCKRLADEKAHLADLIGASVVVSDSSEAGEGEHKIFARINSPELPRVTQPTVVYGADADLIMLSMRSLSRLFVLREDQHNKFVFVDVAMLRRKMPLEPDEFVVLCMFLGNDFVPPLSFLRVKERGVDYLVEKYCQMKKADPEFRLGDAAGLRFHSLLQMLEAVGADEDGGFHHLDAVYMEARQRRFGGPLSGSDAWARAHEACDASKIKPGTHGWRQRYYSLLFPPMDVSGICELYLTGLSWTYAYYFAYSKSNAKLSDWYYPYAYSPTSLDVMNHLVSMGEEGFVKASSFVAGPVTSAAVRDPTLQLLLVLPPASDYLIEEHLRPLIHDVAEGCKHFYPTKFKLATYLKWHVSDCLAVLPAIDGSIVNKVMQRLSRRKKRLKI